MITMLLKKNVIPLSVFALSAGVVLCWNIYVFYYNNINHASYFLVQPRPIWELSRVQIAEIGDYISNYWYSRYYYQSTWHFFLVVFITGILFVHRSNKVFLIPSVLLMSGGICYFLLFFAQFKDHDYYFITLIPAIIFMTVNSFMCLKIKFPGLVNHYIPKLLLVFLCLLSINYAREKLKERYENPNDRFAMIGLKLAGARQFLASSGVPANAKFIILPDQTPNGGLYFINRQGWSIKDTSEASMADINKYTGQGADYMLITDRQYSKIKFNGLKIAESNNMLLYKMRDGK